MNIVFMAWVAVWFGVNTELTPGVPLAFDTRSPCQAALAQYQHAGLIKLHGVTVECRREK